MDKAILKGKNSFCGPAALALLLKTDTDVAAKTIRMVSKQYAVKGAYTSHVLKVIHKYRGICVKNRDVQGMPQWKAAKGSPLTLITTELNCGEWHFMLMHRGKLFDNHTKKWIKATKHPNRNGKIIEAHAIHTKPRLLKRDVEKIINAWVPRQYY